jgi:thiosulfate dehydrogenase
LAAGYESADGINGGMLFDKFYATSDKEKVALPKFSNAFRLDLSEIGAAGDFYRCKQCHGWDRLGCKGAYIGRAAKAGKRPNVSGANLALTAKTYSPKKLFARIATPGKARPTNFDPTSSNPIGDRMPAYGKIFSEAEIWDVVKFLKENAYDTTALYKLETEGTYPSGSVSYAAIGRDGNAKAGRTIFEKQCGDCHGDNGLDIDLGGKSVGQFLRTKAYEVHHKVGFGQLGSRMKPTKLSPGQMRDLYKALTDKAAFPSKPAK